MAEKKSTKKKPKKTKVYECLYHEHWYDDLGKGVLCHHPNLPNECICSQDCTYIYSQQMCPGYRKGPLLGSWAISKKEKDDAKKFKETIELRKRKSEEDLERKERGLFIQTGVSDKGHPLAFKIDTDDKDEILHILREKGYDEITILRTSNLCSAEILPIVPHGVKGTKIWVYPISPEFNEQYGPFEEVEKIDLKSFVSESADDEQDETFNVLRQIKGLSVKKLGNGKYRLKLS